MLAWSERGAGAGKEKGQLFRLRRAQPTSTNVGALRTMHSAVLGSQDRFEVLDTVQCNPLCPRYARGRIDRALVRMDGRIPRGTRQNDGLETGIMGATAVTF